MPEPCKFPSLDSYQKTFLWTTASPTLQGAPKDGFGEPVVARDTPEPCEAGYAAAQILAEVIAATLQHSDQSEVRGRGVVMCTYSAEQSAQCTPRLSHGTSNGKCVSCVCVLGVGGGEGGERQGVMGNCGLWCTCAEEQCMQRSQHSLLPVNCRERRTRNSSAKGVAKSELTKAS